MADNKVKLIYEATSELGVVISDLSKILELQRDITKAVQDATQANVTGATSQRQALQDLQKTITTVSDEEKKKATESKKANQEQAQAIKDINAQYQAIRGTLTGLAGLVATVFSIGQAKAFIMDMIDAKSKVDNFKNTLLSMGDSVASVNSVSLAIQKLDERSAFTSEQLLKTATALKANSIPTEDLVNKLTMLGTVSALVGEQKLPLIAKAYLDVRNKQVLMAQETRQFIENGVPLYDLLATSMDKPKQAVIDMAKVHEISFADVEKALKESTEKGGIYYGALETKAKSLQGQVSNLSATFFYGKKNLADYFEGTLQTGINIIRDFIDASLGSDKAIGRTIEYVKAGVAVWLSYQTSQIALNASLRANQSQTLLNMETQVADNGLKVVGTGITTSLTGAVNGLNLAIRANPFGFALSALTLLISAFYMYKAVTTDVVEAQNEEINGLNKLKVGFQTQLQAIANTTAGTEQRTQAVLKMKALYPEYLSKIDLETAGTNELHKALDLANIQFERKIRLASANAQVDIISKKALDIENERYQIISKLRETYKELSTQYLNDSRFITALNQKVLKEQIEIRGEYGELITTTDKGTKAFLKNYADLGTQSRDTYKEIERVTLNAHKVSLQVQNEDYANLRRQLRNKEISLADYNKAVLVLDNARRKENEKGEEESETKINKKKVEQRIFTANELKVIELSNAKDTFENRKDLLEAELKVDIERVNERLKGEKDAEIKVKKEITNLIKKYNLDLADLQDDHYRYLDRKRNEDFYEIKKEASQSFADLAKLDDSYLSEREKEKRKHEDRVDKLTDTLNEARAKEANARMMLDEINSAKSAQEKYEVILKYGRRTNDELTALNLDKWKKDEKAQTTYVKFLGESGEEWQKEYQKQLEILLALRIKISNAETKVVTETANEQLQIIKRNQEFIKAFFSDTFKMASDTFTKMTAITKDFLDYSVEANRRAYDRQYDLLEGNTQARIKLAQDFAEKEEQMLISNARFQKFSSFIGSLTKAYGEYYDKKMKNHEQYQARIQEIDNMGLDSVKANDLKATASSQQKLANISSAVSAGLGMVSDYMTLSYNLEIQQLDAQLKNIRAYYTERLKLVTETKDASIKALEEEEKKKLESLDKQKEAEITSVKDAKEKGIITAEEADVKLREIDDRYSIYGTDITKKTAEEKKKIEDQYIKDTQALKEEQAKREDEIERQKFEAQKEMMISQILIQGLMAEAALLPYYAALVTLPYAIAAAIAIAVATGAMIAKVSGMQYKSTASAYSPVGWKVNEDKIAPPSNNTDDKELGITGPEQFDNILPKYEDAPYKGKVANRPGTSGDDGHEMPIRNVYDTTTGAYIKSIYEDDPIFDQYGNVIGYNFERTTPNFFQGSDYIERGMYPSGKDQIPAMVNEGERIVPTDKNEELGGRSLSNDNLVKFTKIGKLMTERIPNIVDMIAKSGVSYKLNYDIAPMKTNNDDLIKEVRKIVDAVKEKESSKTSINIDPYNVTVEEQYDGLRINYKNQQYKRRQ